MPRGWMSLFSVSAWSLYEWPEWSRWTHPFQWPRWPQWSRSSQWSPAPKWPSETSEETEGPLGHKSPKAPEEKPEWPKVHTTQRYEWPQLPHKPQQSPTWLNKTAKCVDDKWNIHPDDFCVNAGPKPSCATPVNGQCKAYPWAHASQPATSTANGCLAGTYEDISDDSSNWKWKCNGKNWGTEDICSVGKLSCNSDEEASTIEQVWNTNQCRILSTPKCMKKSITVNYTGKGCWACPFGQYHSTSARSTSYYCKDFNKSVKCWQYFRRFNPSEHPRKMYSLEWSHTQQYDIETFKNQCKKI